MTNTNTNGTNGARDAGVTAIFSDKMEAAGAFTYWSLSGSCDYSKLRAAWLDQGLREHHLIEPAKQDTALRLAMMDRKNRHTNVERLKDGGWALVSKKAKQDAAGADVEHSTDLRVWLGNDQLRFAPASDPRCAEVRASFNRYGYELASGQVSVWLVKQIRRLLATNLKATGGVYYVLPEHVEEWHKIANAVQSVSHHTIYAIKALKTDEGAMRSIMDAIVNEARKEMEAVSTELQDSSKQLGKRAIETRKGDLRQLEAKLRRYETLLGVYLEDVRTQLDTTDNSLTIALLDAERAKTSDQPFGAAL